MENKIAPLSLFNLPPLWQWGECNIEGKLQYSIGKYNIEQTTFLIKAEKHPINISWWEP